MSTASRALRIQSITRRSTVSMTSKRSFHSPFAMLSNAITSSTHSSSMTYEKSTEASPEPRFNYSGRKTYVVCEPDPHNFPYKVPPGAYPTSEPYVNYEATNAPESYDMSSTSSSPAHSQTNNLNGLGERNPAPLGKAAQKYSRMGNAEAWKARN